VAFKTLKNREKNYRWIKNFIIHTTLISSDIMSPNSPQHKLPAALSRRIN